MKTKTKVKEPVLVVCGVCLLMVVMWQYFLYLSLVSVGNSPPPPFRFISEVQLAKPHSKSRSRQKPFAPVFYNYQYTDTLKVSSSSKPFRLGKDQGICVYNLEKDSSNLRSDKIEIVSELSKLDFKMINGGEYTFAEGNFLDASLQLRRYLPGNIYVSGDYIATSVCSFNVYSGIRTANNWLIIWRKGRSRPVYRCVLQGELLGFEVGPFQETGIQMQ